MMEPAWETRIFVTFLEKVLRFSRHNLAKIFIGQDYQHLKCYLGHSSVPTLSFGVCWKMLRMPKLECLVVSDWAIKSFLDYPCPFSSSLKSLHLPVESINEGTALSSLRRIATSFPNLVSFQSRITSLDSAVEGSEVTTNGLCHGLETLSVGNAFPNRNPQEVLDIARYIFALFPKLKEIRTHECQMAKKRPMGLHSQPGSRVPRRLHCLP
jgi:hypothetical protein